MAVQMVKWVGGLAGKGEVHPITGHEGPVGEQRYSSTLSLTSTVDGVGGQRHASAALPLGKTRYPLYRRLGGPQGRSVRVQNISPSTGIRSLDRPARSEPLYRLSYRGPLKTVTLIQILQFRRRAGAATSLTCLIGVQSKQGSVRRTAVCWIETLQKLEEQRRLYTVYLQAYHTGSDKAFFTLKMM